MQCCRTDASECKLVEYFFPQHFQIGFSMSIRNINFRRGFQRITYSAFQRVSKRFKRVSEGFQKSFKAFQKGFQRVSKGFPKGFKAFQKGFQRFQSVSKGFPKGFKPSKTGFPKGFRVTSNPLENAFVDKTCFCMEGHNFFSFLLA